MHGGLFTKSAVLFVIPTFYKNKRDKNIKGAGQVRDERLLGRFFAWKNRSKFPEKKRRFLRIGLIKNAKIFKLYCIY